MLQPHLDILAHRVVGADAISHRHAVLALTGRLLAADPVDRPAVSHCQQPRRHGAPGDVEPARVAPRLDEDLLRHLLGLRRVPQDLAHDPEDASGVAVVQLRERVPIAQGDAVHQLLVGDDGAALAPADRLQPSSARCHRDLLIGSASLACRGRDYAAREDGRG